MAVLKILKYPDPFLRRKTVSFDFSASQAAFDVLDILTENVFDTLYAVDKGAAMAANQIGIDQSFFVFNKNQSLPEGMPLLIINPEIISNGSEEVSEKEGCLSFPGIAVMVRRPLQVRVAFNYRDGERTEMDLNGWIARVFQHETDHLNGMLFVDALSNKKKIEIVNTLKRMK